jgi:dienelactone hydrolase
MFERLLCCALAVAAAAGLPACKTPDYTSILPGPYAFTYFHTAISPDLPEVTVFLPQPGQVAGPSPAIVFSTGWNVPRAAYADWAQSLAEWGYVVVVRSSPSLGLIGIGDVMVDVHVGQVSAVIDWLHLAADDPASPLFGRVDPERIGVTGHSMGATVAVLSAVHDPRVDAVVSLDVSSTDNDLDARGRLPESQARFMVVAGDEGGWCGTPPGSRDALTDVLPAPAVSVTIHGADHMDFIGIMTGLIGEGETYCPTGTADPAEVRRIGIRYMLAWFDFWLLGDVSAADTWSGDAAAADEAAGIVRIEQHPAR